jgi:hypothetical protein
MNVKQVARRASERSIEFQPTTEHYIPEHRTLDNHHYENLKSFREPEICGIYMFK